MNKLAYIVITLAFAIFPLNGCSERSSAQTPGCNNVNDTTELRTEIDSLSNVITAINTKIDSLENVVTKHEDAIKKQKESKAEKYFWWIVIGIAGSIIISAISFKIASFDDPCDKHGKKLTDRIDDNERRIAWLESCSRQQPQPSQQNLASLVNRINKLEQLYADLKGKCMTSNKPSSNIAVENQTKPNSVKGYFGNPIAGGYFSELKTVREDRVKFEAEATGDRASFKPLNINVLKSNDNMRLAIELRGNTSNYTSHTIRKEGLAEKDSSGKWIIKQKTIVELI